MQHQSIKGGSGRGGGGGAEVCRSGVVVTRTFFWVTCSMLYCKHVASFGSRSTVQQYKVQVINNT